MSFTPNMSSEEVAKIDKERGKKFSDPEDNWPTDDHPTEKKPWLIKTPVNKSGENDMDGTSILKLFVNKSRSSADGSLEKACEHNTKDCMHHTDAEELGMCEKFGKASLSADDDFFEDLKKYVEKNVSQEFIDMDFLDEDHKGEKTEKALNSRSMHIPRPPGGYDRFDITRSATTATSRQHSKLMGPEGVAPLIGDTMRTAEDDAMVRTRTGQETYKSCNFHGLIHRASTGCVMCTDSISKSNSCPSCGDEMSKVSGGGYSCKACK